MMWTSFPKIEQNTPVIALTTDANRLWAGWVGGVAAFTGGEWQLSLSSLSTAALAWSGENLLAGGMQGIARWHNGQWRKAVIQGNFGAITSITASRDIALAGTLTAGIVRSEDGGREWKPSTFGLTSYEITALAWLDENVALAATENGVFCSPNAGRAWQLCAGTENGPFAALAALPDGTALAGVEIGGMMRSTDGGLNWARYGDLPPDVQIFSMLAANDVVLMGTLAHGLLRSIDNGATWQEVADATVLAMAANANSIYAGTDSGILTSSDGAAWMSMSYPPLHDLRKLVLFNNAPLVYGTHANPMILQDGIWVELDNAPNPLHTLAVSPDGALLASGSEGLLRSTDAGASWQTAVEGGAGIVAHICVQGDGLGFAGSGDGTRLLRTHNYGVSWEWITPPFGVLPLAALQVVSSLVVAATFDPRRDIAQIWRSLDMGTTWQRGAEIKTTWPVVSTLGQPLLLALGNMVFIQHPEGGWQSYRVGDNIYRVVGDSNALYALTVSGVSHSVDSGQKWTPLRDLPVGEIADIALHKNTLYLLMTDGTLWQMLTLN